MGTIMMPDIEFADVFIDIHCIGQNPQGEGIILIIRTNEQVIYSGLIDECPDENFLSNNNINKLDFICWSHPHVDHSEGLISVIKNHSGKNTKIIVPTGIFDFNESLIDNNCKDTYEIIKNINKHGKISNGEYNEVNNLSHLPIKKYMDKNGKEIDISIEALSPISKRINNSRFNKYIDMNELSVCLIISINDVKFLFTSDIFNKVISDMNLYEGSFENIVYCKIPHHGSIKSDNLLLYLNSPKTNNNMIAVSTIYKKNGEDMTPNTELISKYLDKGFKVFCTNISYINGIENDYKYGIVSTRIKLPIEIYPGNLEWDIKFEGEADQVSKEEMLFK